MKNNTKKYEFKDNSKPYRFVVGSFKAYLVVTLIVLVMSAAMAVIHNSYGPYYDYGSDPLTGWIYLISGISLMLFTLIYSISGLCFLYWLYRASCNMQALSPETKFKFTPKWNIASYFIPFVCVVWPYQAMNELWSNLKSAQSRTPEKTVLIWWVSFMAYMVIKRTANGFPGEGFQGLSWFSIFMIPTAILGLVSCYHLLKLVKDVGPQQSPARQE